MISKATPSFVFACDEGIRLRLYVQPRAGKTELVGQYGDRLKIRIAAAPVKGKANAELRKLLARLLRVPKSSILLQAGATGRRKTVIVPGVTASKAVSKLLPDANGKS